MNVWIEPQLFEREECFSDLRRLIDQLGPLRSWVVDDRAQVRSSAWYAALGPTTQRDVEVLLQASRTRARTGAGCWLNVVDAEPHFDPPYTWRLPPAHAVGFVQQPLALVLEHAEHDGAFVYAIMFIFGERELARQIGRYASEELKRRWRSALGAEPWLSLAHGGGGTVGSVIGGLRRRYASVPPRLLVVVDRDAYGPDEAYRWGKTWTHATKALLDEPEATRQLSAIHITERREMENYLPEAVLRAWATKREHRDFVAAYAELSAEQRAFIDLKRGLRSSVDLPNHPAPEPSSDPATWSWRYPAQRRLYASLSPAAASALWGGLGDRVGAEAWDPSIPTLNRRTLSEEAAEEFRCVFKAIVERL